MIKFTQFITEKPVWDNPIPKGKQGKGLSAEQKAKAKARAKAAGRPYPNMVDNIWAANEEKVVEARYSRRVPAGQRLLKQIGEYERRQQQGMEAAKKKEEQKPVKEENLAEMDNRTPSSDRREQRYYSPEEKVRRKEKFEKDLKLNPKLRKKLRLPEPKEDVKEEKSLGKPFRTPGGPKKFAVYVKNPESGNTKKVTFGDPNLSIKRDNPERRKSFRARHNCENPGPRTKARYWSCRQWRAGAKVEA